MKKSAPLLYEFSQMASNVTSSVLPLQSAPAEECSLKFADYRGIIDSLAKELGSMTPPPKLESVHEKSMQALTDYSSGLELYYKACTEKDYGIKESLVSQGGVYLTNSVTTIGKAYGEIEKMKSERVAEAKQRKMEEIKEAELSGAGMSGENSAEEYGAEGVGAKAEPRSEKVKSKEEVIKEISTQVESKNEAPVVKKARVTIHDKKVEAEPPHLKEQPVTDIKQGQAKSSKPAEPLKTTAPEVKATAKPIATETKTQGLGDVKTQNSPPQKAETSAQEKGAEEPAKSEKKMSDKEKVEKLNQKIMEQANINQVNEVSKGTETAKAEPAPAAPEDHGENASPELAGSGDSTARKAPDAGNKEAAIAPQGGAPDEEKGPADDIISWCHDRYQTAAEQESCMKSRTAAKNKTEKLMNEYSQGTKERQALDKCVTDWKEGDTYNYEMIISCTQFYCAHGGIEKCKNLSQ
ncbi:MAG: hypothetical protein ACHQ6U_11455 [Thermodesulfobacteriota bacterium]